LLKLASQSTTVSLTLTKTSTNRDAVSLSWRRSVLHADRLLLLLPTVTDLNDKSELILQQFRYLKLPQMKFICITAV